MKLTIQNYLPRKGWIDAAEVTFLGPNKVCIEYDIDYGSKNFGYSDLHALSMTNPVNLEIKESDIPGYLVDLIPQGNVLKKIIGRYNISSETNYYEILSKIPLSSPGNIRIKEAWSEIDLLRSKYDHQGFSKEKITELHSSFIEYMEQHDSPIGGTSGAGGGAPKFLLREDHAGKFHADGLLSNSKTKQAWLIKLPFTDSTNSKLLLKTEKHYYDILKALELKTGKPLEWVDDVLFVPRFDRYKEKNNTVSYYGLESFYSAQSINIYGAQLSHEQNLNLIKKHSSKPELDIIEYLKRDIINQALSNTDNHGRNTSFIKKENHIELSPIYDVTAMKFFNSEIISPLTRWNKKNQSISQQVNWVISNLEINKSTLYNALKEFESKLLKLETLLVNYQVPEEIIELSKDDRNKVITDLKNYRG